MSRVDLEVDLANRSTVRLEDGDVTARPPASIEFSAEGSVSVGAGALDEFVGRTVRPSSSAFSVDGETVTVDFRGDASLRLRSLDVGVAVTDPGDALSEAVEVASSGTVDGVGTVSFTVEGVIEGVDEETIERLSAGSPEFESVTFSVRESLESDGGRDGSDALVDFGLFGYGIVVRRDGTISIAGRQG